MERKGGESVRKGHKESYTFPLRGRACRGLPQVSGKQEELEVWHSQRVLMWSGSQRWNGTASMTGRVPRGVFKENRQWRRAAALTYKASLCLCRGPVWNQRRIWQRSSSQKQRQKHPWPHSTGAWYTLPAQGAKVDRAVYKLLPKATQLRALVFTGDFNHMGTMALCK